MDTKKSIAIVILVLVVALGVAYSQKKTNKLGMNGGEGVACTLEAKQCPDGTFVGRSGPLCEFARCPGIKAPVDHSNVIVVDAPVANAVVKSPITITGKAKGWYFEGSFPIHLFDANGKSLGASPAKAKGGWMTSEFVSFSTTLSFTKPTTKTGILVLQKDNPSGLPENDDSISIPVTFSQ